MDDAEAAEHVFWQYRHHKRRWRRLTHKPARRFRRFVRKFVRKNRFGKGKGKCRPKGGCLLYTSDAADDM
eukprot:133028-Alexandrium_andersonii.AAC.1